MYGFNGSHDFINIKINKYISLNVCEYVQERRDKTREGSIVELVQL